MTIQEVANVRDVYDRAAAITRALEVELKRLERWRDTPLPEVAFKNMGAFGENTMAFEQWIQFVLLPRVHQIIADRDEFPPGSMLAAYAVRAFDGDPDAGYLHDLLYALDTLADGDGDVDVGDGTPNASGAVDTVTLGDAKLPEVVYTLAGVLPQYAFEELESNLQTFDMFLQTLSPAVRPELGLLLLKAAGETADVRCRKRIENAARRVAAGQCAAEPVDHMAAMLAYRAQHHRNFNQT